MDIIFSSNNNIFKTLTIHYYFYLIILYYSTGLWMERFDWSCSHCDPKCISIILSANNLQQEKHIYIIIF